MKYLRSKNSIIGLAVLAGMYVDIFVFKYSRDIFSFLLLILWLILIIRLKITSNILLIFGLLSLSIMVLLLIFGNFNIGLDYAEKFAMWSFMFFILTFIRSLKEA